MDCTELRLHFDTLETQRKNLDGTLELIEKFVVPFRGNFFHREDSEHEIEWRKRDKYDDTAVMAAQTLAASMQGSLTSFVTKWFDARFRVEELNTNDEAKEWLEECVKIMYQSLQDSNFNLEASEYYLDIVSFGTAVLLEEVEEAPNGEFLGLDFSAIPLRDCYFEMDHKNRVLKMFRVLNWTALQIVSKFGKEHVPDDLVKESESSKGIDIKHKVIFAIYNRPENKDADVSTVLTADARPFGKKYFLHKECTILGNIGGYYEMPAFVSRWRKVSGSKMGYSPAMVVMGDILTLNELKEATLEALAKVVDPATITTERGLMSDLDLGRGGLTVVRNLDDIKTYESKARFDVGQVNIEDLRRSINQAFHVDQLQLKESPAMTATEVQVRYELMQRLLGPTLGRLQNDFLDPLIERTFSSLLRANKFPPIPNIVKESGTEFDVEYVGPLPRAQRMEEVQAIDQWIARLASVAEVFPQVLDLPDIDAIGRGTGEMAGVPAKYINDAKQVEENRRIKEEKQKQQELLMNLQQAGEAGQAMGKAKQELSQ